MLAMDYSNKIIVRNSNDTVHGSIYSISIVHKTSGLNW